MALVGFDCALKLSNQRFLGVELLLGNGIFLEKGAVPFQIDLRIGQQCLVANELPFGLRELHLKRAGIDFR